MPKHPFAAICLIIASWATASAQESPTTGRAAAPQEASADYWSRRMADLDAHLAEIEKRIAEIRATP